MFEARTDLSVYILLLLLITLTNIYLSDCEKDATWLLDEVIIFIVKYSSLLAIIMSSIKTFDSKNVYLNTVIN